MPPDAVCRPKFGVWIVNADMPILRGWVAFRGS
jgi:hypothetical protein